MKETNIVEMQRVIVVTCRSEESPVEFRHLECGTINEALAQRDAVPFREIGPCFNMRIRREKIAAPDAYKEACRQPKIRNPEKKKADKNKFTTALGDKKGKVFIQHQDLDTLATRKYKGMGKKAKKVEKVEAEDV